MHVLITGGAGFIGSHLVDLHLARGDKVHVVDNLSTGRRENLAQHEGRHGLRVDVADILTWDGLKQAVAWADRIYHMAAVVGVKRVLEDPVLVMGANVAGTERLLRAVKDGGWNPQVLLASSSEVYGFNPNLPYDETAQLVFASGARLRWAYAVTKLSDEFLGFSFFRRHGLDVKVARLFNTVGPRQVGVYGMVVPNFVRQAVAGLPITVFGDGTQTRCFCDVRDTTVALDLLAGAPAAAGEVVNVGNDREISIGDLAQLVARRANSASEIRLIPYAEAYGEEFEDIPRRVPVLDKLKRLSGFEARWTLEETLDELIEHARAVDPERLVVSGR